MIPKFKYYFSPFLKILSSHKAMRLYDLSNLIAKELNLSAEDLSEKTKGGSSSKHSSRVNYCAAYLKKMGFVESYSVGVYQITIKGRKLLSDFGSNFTLDDMRELPEYIRTQIDPNKSNVVYVQTHLRGGKVIKPYVCSRNQLSKKNPNATDLDTKNI